MYFSYGQKLRANSVALLYKYGVPSPIFSVYHKLDLETLVSLNQFKVKQRLNPLLRYQQT